MRQTISVISAGDSPLHRAIWRVVSGFGIEIASIDTRCPETKYDPVLVEPGFSAGKCSAPRSPKARRADVEAARFAHQCCNRFVYFCPFIREGEPSNLSGRGAFLTRSVPELLSRLATPSYAPIGEKKLQLILRPAVSRIASRTKHDLAKGKPEAIGEARGLLRQVRDELDDGGSGAKPEGQVNLSGNIPDDLSSSSEEELIHHLEEVKREYQ